MNVGDPFLNLNNFYLLVVYWDSTRDRAPTLSSFVRVALWMPVTSGNGKEALIYKHLISDMREELTKETQSLIYTKLLSVHVRILMLAFCSPASWNVVRGDEAVIRATSNKVLY